MDTRSQQRFVAFDSLGRQQALKHLAQPRAGFFARRFCDLDERVNRCADNDTPVIENANVASAMTLEDPLREVRKPPESRRPSELTTWFEQVVEGLEDQVLPLDRLVVQHPRYRWA